MVAALSVGPAAASHNRRLINPTAGTADIIVTNLSVRSFPLQHVNHLGSGFKPFFTGHHPSQSHGREETETVEKTKKICLEDNTPPTRSGRVNTLKANKEELLKEGCFKEGTLSKDALLYDKGNLALTSYFKEGKVTIQDESSQLVARLLDPQKTDYVLDMCSAPGSKTTHLSALMENQGKIEAYDLYEHKVKLVEYNLRRLDVKNVHIQAGDSTKLKEVYSEKTFDRILLDAPCSGFGVLKRKPEIKYHDSSIMDGLVSLQELLLENAYYLLKNDGTMVYSTCTINKKENELMIQKFIEKHPDMEVIKQRTILNYEYHTDGFFMCKMKKG